MSQNGPFRIARAHLLARKLREQTDITDPPSEFPTDEHTVVDEAPLLPVEVDPGSLPSLVLLAGKEAGRVVRLSEGNVEIGRATAAGHLRLGDDNVSRRHAVIVSAADAPSRIYDLGSTNGTRVNGVRIGPEGVELEEGDQIQLAVGVVLKFTCQHPLEEALRLNLYDSAVRDSLTRLYNKRHLLDRLDEEYAWALRHRRPLSAAVLDLDHFKTVNDTHGHAMGDRVLQAVAELLTSCCRVEDTSARYGGEEFVLLQRDTPIELARVACERVRRSVASLAFTAPSGTFSLSVSIGLAASNEPGLANPGDLFNLADARLYAAKRGGRDRVVADDAGLNPAERLTGGRRRA